MLTKEQIQEINQWLVDTQPNSTDDYAVQDTAKSRVYCKRLLKALEVETKRTQALENATRGRCSFCTNDFQLSGVWRDVCPHFAKKLELLTAIPYEEGKCEHWEFDMNRFSSD